MPKYPNIEVELSGHDGNAFSVIARVTKELRRAGVDPADFVEEATSGDYEHLLRTAAEWVEIS